MELVELPVHLEPQEQQVQVVHLEMVLIGEDRGILLLTIILMMLLKMILILMYQHKIILQVQLLNQVLVLIGRLYGMYLDHLEPQEHQVLMELQELVEQQVHQVQVEIQELQVQVEIVEPQEVQVHQEVEPQVHQVIHQEEQFIILMIQHLKQVLLYYFLKILEYFQKHQ